MGGHDDSPALVWIDMEMSGHQRELEVLAEGPDLVVHQPDEVLDAMDEWCTDHHGASGLTAAVRA
ncbi:MAG: oligoribonuclease, partial [Nannocystaceae bacterium]